MTGDELAQAAKTFFVWVARIVLYPALLVWRIIARAVLLICTAAPIGLPLLVLGGLVWLFWTDAWPVDFRLGEHLGERSPITRGVLFLIGAGVFASILKVLSEHARKETRSLGKAVWAVLRTGWMPSIAIVEGLSTTWHDNIAKIRSNTRQSLKSAWHVTFALVAGVLLAVAAYPLFERPVQTVDRYVAVVDARDTSQATRQEIKLYMRSGAVFSLAHVEDAQPQTGEGICLGESQQAWLREFRTAIANCVDEGRRFGKTRKPEDLVFKVTGYASVAPMHVDNDPTESSKLNCKVANWRAQAVGAFLADPNPNAESARWWRCDDVKERFNLEPNECGKFGKECYGCEDAEGSGPSGFRVEVRRWSAPGDMVRGKPADDGTAPEQRRFNVEILNRVVHIEVPNDFCGTEASTASTSAKDN